MMSPTFGRRAWLSAAIATCACRARGLPRSIEALLTVQDDLGDAPADVNRSRDILFELQASVSARSVPGQTLIDAINYVIFEQFGFEREVESTDLRHVFLNDVLLARKGSCVGLGSVYFALGQLLASTLDGVVLPGHFYLRQPGHPHRNIETLRKGEAMPDSWYEAKYPVSSGMGQVYGRSLGSRELQGVVAFNVGNERSRQGRWREAEHAFALSVSRFEDFAEAHASLGRVRHLLGDREGAKRAYTAAQTLAPALPGLVENQSLLQAEIPTQSR
jgi:Transglutaminase-like superfamily